MVIETDVGAVTTAVCAETADVDPTELIAFTEERIVKPVSTAVSA